MASITLLALEYDLARPLARILRELRHEVRVTNRMEQTLRNGGSRIVFADGDGPCYRETVQHLRKERPDAAVIVVNRVPNNARWLDALESGATDYCGAPFEAVQVKWILDGVERGLRERVA
jgi:DNA-binding NtrC family response regulator